MVSNEVKSVWPAVLVVCAFLVVSQFMLGLTLNNNIKAIDQSEVDLTGVLGAIAAVDAKVDNITTDSDKLDDVYQVVSEHDQEEAKALELATEYLEDKDFLKELALFLSDEKYTNVSLDYKDLSVEVLDSKVDYKHGKYTVTFDLKVLEDGDKIAKVSGFEVKVIDVDFDDEYKDAEVDEDNSEIVDSTPGVVVRVY
jgi:hypothetical protein